jgi:phenylpropionate dioxygenase-like ring-hydroxylating dioxygenase large terminal subunit
MSFGEGMKKFGNARFLPEGWFWVERSHRVAKGKAAAAELFGKKFVVYRSDSGNIHILDAHCPHMGAHLCDGFVEGDSIRCPFHYWKFSSSGKCIEIPAQTDTRVAPPLKHYKCGEKYGLIWIWTGSAEDTEEIPVVPELRGFELDASLGSEFIKNCHPNVVMINAIDAQHFKSVHQLVVDLNMEAKPLSPRCIQFSNTTLLPRTNMFLRWVSRFYKAALTYEMTYWWGQTGSVVVGPDFLHCYIIFALRPTTDGKTEGQTILVTKKRKLGWLLNPIILFATRLVGNYFATGDTVIFSKIDFKLRTPIRADVAIIRFVEHYESQRAGNYGELLDQGPIFSKERNSWVRENTLPN